MIRLQQEALSSHTSFRIGGPAQYYFIPETREEVAEALTYARENQLPYYIIGKEGNMLFSDDGFLGVVIEVGKGMEKIGAATQI